MNVFSYVVDKVKNALTVISRDHRKYYKYGADDNLLDEIAAAVDDSGTAKSCVVKLTQFTHGSGFEDTALAESQLNPDQTYNAGLYDFSVYASYFKCVAYRVLYNNQGIPAEIHPVAPNKIRRIGKNKFVYNEFYGFKGLHRDSEDVELDRYDPDENIIVRRGRIYAQIKKYKGTQWGDIVYHFKKGVGLHHDIYAVPDYYSGIEDIYSDAGISRIERRNIKRGWKTGVIVSTGPLSRVAPTDDTGKVNGKSPYDSFVETIKKFAEEDAAVAMHIEGATNEAKPDVKTIDVAQVLDATDKATDRIGRKVCRLMGVPPVLVGFASPGQLGQNQELINTMDLFKLTIKETQGLITEALKIVHPEKNFNILPLDLWKTLTPAPNEARKV
jgi:hypothetical protein